VNVTETAQRLDAVRRYASLDAPVDGAFERIARMAARIFSTPMATVSIVDEGRVWFLATEGLDGVRQIGDEPGLCASAILEGGPYVVNDAATDPRTVSHPLVLGELALRFYAAAPIVTADGHALGTVNVLDRKRHRQVTQTQTSLLTDLAATVAEMMEIRLAALTVLRAERAHLAEEIARRDSADRLKEQMSEAAQTLNTSQRPQWCQLGAGTDCCRSAEMKVADSWGDSAWGCWQHAEEALINVPSVFLATSSEIGLAAYRSRARPAPERLDAGHGSTDGNAPPD
jgi:GAF domain-containing protein